MLIKSRENREGGERNGRLIKLTYKNVLTIFLSGKVQEYYERDKIPNETRIESKKNCRKIYNFKKIGSLSKNRRGTKSSKNFKIFANASHDVLSHLLTSFRRKRRAVQTGFIE